MKKVRVPVHRTSPTQSVLIDPAATNGAQIGVNLLDPDGKLVPWPIVAPSTGGTSPNTTDDLDEGQWNLWFTDRRAQDAVGEILADSDNVTLRYVAGTSIIADLTDLADSGTGAALVKITRDTKGRVSGTHAATTDDLTEGSNLYFTDTRADARITLQKAQPLGLATLDTGGKLDAGQLPALAITETFVVNTQAAMLALAAQEGDVAVRTDLSKSFILTAAPASTLTNWQELLTPASPVTSIFGRVGSVTAASGDYTFAQIGSTPTTLAGYGITDAATAAQGAKADSAVQSVVAGTNIIVDNTDPQNPMVSATGGAGSIPAGYIDGLKMVWVSGTALTVTSGNAYIPGTAAVLSAPSDIAKAGLSLTASTWYHVYLYDNAGTPDVEIVTTAPAAPYNGTARSKTGDTSRRYAYSLKTNASGEFIQFVIDSGGNLRYLISNASAPLRALSNGKATTRTTVSLAGAMPVTATHAILQASNTESTTIYANMSNPFAISSGFVGIPPGGVSASSIITFPTDSLQRVDYYYTTAPTNGLYIDVIGFHLER